MRPLALLVALASSFAVVSGASAEPPSCSIPHVEDWREYRSAHFVVATDVSRSAAAALVEELERTHGLVLQALLGEQVEIPGHVRVIAYGDPGAFHAIAGNDLGGFSYHGDLQPALVFPFEGGGTVPTTVAHELAHHISWYVFPQQPRWFAEGLAFFLESVAEQRRDASAPTGSHLVRGRGTGGRWAGLVTPLLATAAKGRTVPARELLGWTGATDPIEPWRHHVASWLLYHWLWNERSKPFTAYQERLSRGDDPELAWREAFPDYDASRPDGLLALDAALERYRTTGRYATYRVDAPEPDARFTEAPIAPAELHLLLLTYRKVWPEKASDRDALVRAAVDEALREDPAHPVAIAWRERTTPGKDRAATLRAAAVGRPGDARGWAALARALDAPKDAKEKEAALLKAVALDPEDATANNELAWLLVTSGRAREARPFADRALDLAPWDGDVIDTLAAVAMGVGQCKAAVQLERRAARLQPDASGDGMRKRLADYEARCAVPAAR